MTPRDEIIYLTSLLIESSKWTRTDADPTGLELEVSDRISRLTEDLDVSEETDNEPEDEPEPEKYERQRKYTANKVRVQWTDADGKTHRTWFDKELCTQIPIAAGCCTKLKWVLKDQAELDKLKEMAEED